MNTYITIARQRGLLARNTGKALADQLGIPYYDNVLMADYADDEVKEYFKSSGELDNMDPHFGTYNFALTQYSTINEQVHDIQNQIINQIADSGSAVFVGRCADYALKDRTDGIVISVFLYADENYRTMKVMQRYNLSEKAAKKHIRTIDKNRSTYYEYYTEKKWGAKESYDLLINAEGLSPEEIAEVIIQYVKNKTHEK